MNRHIDFDAELPALERALKQHLIADRQADGSFIVTSSNGIDTYHISNDMCTCTGFWRWHSCKHIALVHNIQKALAEIVLCEVCGRWLLIVPPMTADEWSKLHD